MSDAIKQNIIECWHKISVESSCKTDTVGARDNEGVVICVNDDSDDDDDGIKHQEIIRWSTYSWNVLVNTEQST